jgi:hypothetical protein
LSGLTLQELQAYVVKLDQRMFAFEAIANNYNNYCISMNNILVHNRELRDQLHKINDMTTRFYEIEKFITYLLNFFDPATKALKKIEKLESTLAIKESELKELKTKLKGILQ